MLSNIEKEIIHKLKDKNISKETIMCIMLDFKENNRNEEYRENVLNYINNHGNDLEESNLLSTIFQI